MVGRKKGRKERTLTLFPLMEERAGKKERRETGEER
jgi:hypothetical protein